MTPREVMTRAIEFGRPARLAISGFGDASDAAYVYYDQIKPPRANGIEEIGRQFAGRICFESLCDIQMTLPRGDKAEIDAEAEALMRNWGTPEGGFVLGDYGDPKAIGTAPETKQYMIEKFRELDPWKNGW